MTPFEVVKYGFYHRIPHGPFEPKTQQLLTSDTSSHLCVLEYIASKSEVVVELGVREGHSTVAFLAGKPKILYSYDIERTSAANLLGNIELPTKWVFTQADSLKIDIPECCSLYFDTLHTYKQLSQELSLHGRKAKKYLIFHDTATTWDKDLSGPDPNAEGIGRAIEEFFAQYPGEYREYYRTSHCNGLLVMERVR